MLRARGETWASIAKQLGVAEKTVYAWQQNAEFRRLVEQYQAQVVDLARSILIDAVPRTAQEVARLAVEAESEHVRVQAAREILDRAGVAPPGGDRQHVGPVIMVQLNGAFGGAPREGNET